MSIAIISDVHANLIAVKSVLDEIDSLGIQKIICAGDLIGYYPFPNEVIEVFKKRGIESILGNHDRAVIRVNTVGMNRLAAEAVRWTSGNITAKNVDYLKSLPSRMSRDLEGIRTSVFHGSPRDDDEYLYEADATPDLLEICGCTLLICGHTHIPYLKRYPCGTILNPGSVGQPRDGDPRACYAIMEGSVVSIRRVEYDIEEMERAVRNAGLPHFLGERLKYGF